MMMNKAHFHEVCEKIQSNLPLETEVSNTSASESDPKEAEQEE
jgi:hypothetical protein